MRKMKTVEGKVVALGFQGVGKTSIIYRFINKTLCARIHPTIGACYSTCYLTVENTRIILKIRILSYSKTCIFEG
ncbi:uncharacterized protein LOC144478742 isoform X1 [Augochlora pura]